jgi:diadenosine tetraphosphate (Ap4A) HIT family hydrolase
LKVLQSALIVAEMIKQSLQPKSINFSLIPSESVPHLHVRVYPVYEDQIPLIENRPQQTTEQELNEIAEKIRAARIETKKEVKEEEKPIEHTEEEAYWIRREIDLA